MCPNSLSLMKGGKARLAVESKNFEVAVENLGKKLGGHILEKN